MFTPLQAVVLAATIFNSLALAQRPLVDLGYSTYQGRVSAGIAQWLGIRYAAPPVGSLRFAAPQDPVKTEGIIDAKQHGSVCIPKRKGNEHVTPPAGTSEDCLFLDVFSPAHTLNSSAKLPVLFWIQGGGFEELSNANYSGVGLVKASGMNMVVVNFNYRVGPYGFLAGAEVQKGASLNNGLRDQHKALKWVHDHISKFGGDPNHIVLAGDSAGGASISLMLTANGGNNYGLFHAVASESQAFPNLLTVNQSQFAYDSLVRRTGCANTTNTLACLRNLDTAVLQRENHAVPYPNAKGPPLLLYSPTLDFDIVQDYTYRLFEQGRFMKVPAIFGDVTNEGTIFVPRNLTTVSQADIFLQNQFPKLTPDNIQKINSWYLQPNETHHSHFPNSTSYWRPTSNAYGELRYICPGIYISSALTKAGVPNWNYRYDVEDPGYSASGKGVSHTTDVNAVWGPQYVTTSVPGSYFSSNQGIVPVVQAYWTSFVRSFDPNTFRGPGSPAWGTWESGGVAYRRLHIRTGQTAMEEVPGAQRMRCQYLSGIGVGIGQ